MTSTHTQANMKSINLEILWDALDSLTWSDIPSDLTEIDANWCYNRLIEYCDGELSEHLNAAGHDELSNMAYEFRDICNESIADDARHLHGRY
jgi:hypothetical protein